MVKMISHTHIKRFFIALLAAASCLLSIHAYATVTAFVDRNPVAQDQSFKLTLQSSDDGTPDLKPLQQDFEILGQSKGTRFEMNNGHVSYTTSWQIMLMPRRAGQLQIPPLTVNGSSTEAIALEVTANGASGSTNDMAAPQDAKLFVQVSATPLDAYVQQQILLTVRLYRAVDLGDGSSLSEPKFASGSAMVERLGQDRTFEEVRNGKNYAIIERRYAITPQQSGKLSMEPILFDGSIVDGGQSGFFLDPFAQRSRRIRVRSEPLQLTIQAAPPQFSGQQWLPAKNLTLTESWSQDPTTMKVGEPITRTLTLTGQGLSAAQLPVLGGDAVDHLKLYPDQPSIKNQAGDQGITGVREQKIAIIPTQPGKLDLPAIDVKWWNTGSNREETARLPARSVMVAAGSNDQSAYTSPPVTAQTPPTGNVDSSARPSRQGGVANWWRWVALALGTGWLLTVLAWWISGTRSHAARPAKVVPKARPDTAKSAEGKLKQACLALDAPQATMHLLAWAKSQWPNNPPTSLSAMARLCEPGLASALNELDRMRYAEASTSWNGEALWKKFQTHKTKVKSDTPGKNAPLASLYESSEKK
ncbi:MAG: protein BatD [Herminiimonas sp.]|nr:protein BatD [Herminiimonas sp.]